MKALILVGGYGTRLRPLTFSRPKPIVELGNIPMMAHLIEALAQVNVTEIVLAIGYQVELIVKSIEEFQKKYGVKITCSLEKEPMGTAGPIRLAEEILRKDNPEELFFVFNSDVICKYPLKDLIAFHKKSQAEGTIMLTEVKEPSRYGVILANENGKINQFIEKPQVYVGNRINAGMYLLSTKVIDRIPLRPCSIEREIFPAIAAEGKLYSMLLDGFWIDVGLPQDFLKGNQLYLEHLENSKSEKLAQGENIKGRVLIDETAKVDPTAVLGPDVVIGPNCVVGAGSRLQKTIVLADSKIGNHSWMSETIIGWKSKVGNWVRIDGLSILGEDVTIKDELYINASTVLPNKSVAASLPTKGTIIM